jgi:hypothetical protein
MFNVVRIDSTKDVTRDITAILGTIRKCRTVETAKRIARLENEKISNQLMGWEYKVFAA